MDQQTAIAQVKLLQESVQALNVQIDQLLHPITQTAIKNDHRAETVELINSLPRGFHRTELRTWHIKRMEYHKYRRQDPSRPQLLEAAQPVSKT